jgi:transposase InsO family protein
MAVEQHRFTMHTTTLLDWVGLRKSSYYYRPSNGKRGFVASIHTYRRDGTLKTNEAVVDTIKDMLRQEFVCYGHRKVTYELKAMQYVINHKKVYRLMREAHLLYHQKIQTHSGPRSFVRYRVITAQYPMQYVCMDIKYVYIHGEGRNAYLLTVLDVYSRRVVAYCFQTSIKQDDVIYMLQQMIQRYPSQAVTIRNDNGSQFIATRVRLFLKSKGIYQEFSHVSTPEDNAYIEAFHSLVEREVIRRYEFDFFYHAERTFHNYYRFYNERRLHSAIKYQTPNQVWNAYFDNQNKENHLIQITKTVQLIGG